MANDKVSLGTALQAFTAATALFTVTGFLAVRAHLQSLGLPPHASLDTQAYLQVGGRIAFGILGQTLPMLAALVGLWVVANALARALPALTRWAQHPAVLRVGLALLSAAAMFSALSGLDHVVDLDTVGETSPSGIARPVLLAEALLILVGVWTAEQRDMLPQAFGASFVQRQVGVLTVALVAAAIVMLPVAFGRTEMAPRHLDRVEIGIDGGKTLQGGLVFSDTTSHFVWTTGRVMVEIPRRDAKEIRYGPRPAARQSG